jgi:hypothetical protein
MAISNDIYNSIGAKNNATQQVTKPDSMDGFSINEFKSIVLKNGLLKNNLYLVNFQQAPFPSGLFFFTESVNIPAIDMDTQQIHRYGYGPIEQVAFRPVFTPMTMSFFVEATQENVLAAMINNISAISPFMNYTTMSSPVSVSGTNTSATPYEVAYKADYSFNLEVYVYNEQQDKILIYTFRDCFARTVSGIQLAWGSENQLLRADITFSYTDYSILAADSIVAPSGEGDNIESINNLQNILGQSSLSDTFNSIQNPLSVLNAININNASSLFGVSQSGGNAFPGSDLVDSDLSSII